MEISCAFPTALDSPDHIVLAEELGYDRAWLYDTPQQSTDVWVTLALAAERTERIGLGPGVLVPSLRHPMVNAAATANLEALAPGRVVVAFGTGFTGRRAMGYRAIPWKFMDAYIRAYRDLLRGETIEWEGARMKMLHPPGHGARAAGRRPDHHRRARAEGRCGGARARRRPLHHARAARVRDGVRLGLLPVLGHDPGRRRGAALRSRARGRRPGLGARLPRRLRVRHAARGHAGRRGVEGSDRAPRARGAPPCRPLGALRRAQRGRPGGVGRGRPPDPRRRDDERHAPTRSASASPGCPTTA